MSFQKLGSSRTLVSGNGSAFHFPLPTAALVRSWVATSTEGAPFLSASIASAACRRGQQRGRARGRRPPEKISTTKTGLHSMTPDRNGPPPHDVSEQLRRFQACGALSFL